MGVDPQVAQAASRYLATADGLLPGTVTGFYLVGSVALGAYRPGRSDIDFVAVLDGDLWPSALRRLRLLHARSGLEGAARSVRHRRSPWTGTCNGVFVRRADLATPVSEIVPVASHTGTRFTTEPPGSDLSPVAWNVLAERGVPLRGAGPGSLGLDPQPELLRSWNLGNLEHYWRPWATAVLRAPAARFRLRPRSSTAWGALGPARLHHTIATGEVISKEAAGEHALDVLASRWHPLVLDALAHRRGEPAVVRWSPEDRGVRTAELVLHVIDEAHDLGPTAADGQ